MSGEASEKQEQAESKVMSYPVHAPKGDQQDRYVKLRAKAKELAEMILHYCPPSRELILQAYMNKEA